MTEEPSNSNQPATISTEAPHTAPIETQPVAPDVAEPIAAVPDQSANGSAPVAQAVASEPPAESGGGADVGGAEAGGEEPGGVSEDAADHEPGPDVSYSDERENVQPLEFIDESSAEDIKTEWYILKVQVNREESIADSLTRRVKVAGLERYFAEIIVPTESVREFSKTGKQRTVKKKLYPGYIMVNMAINDDTWFLVRETPGIGDFTGRAGKPTPMDPKDVKRILDATRVDDTAGGPVKTTISFKHGDRVRVKEGYFQNFEGDVETIDEANGRVTVMINIFGRSTPVELEHWQIEAL